jgi:hypothetical protein
LEDKEFEFICIYGYFWTPRAAGIFFEEMGGQKYNGKNVLRHNNVAIARYRLKVIPCCIFCSYTHLGRQCKLFRITGLDKRWPH